MTLNAIDTFAKTLLTPEQIALFYKQGFLILRNVYDPAVLATLRQQCDKLTHAGLKYQAMANERHSTAVCDRFVHFQQGTKFVFRRGDSSQWALSHVVGCDGMAPDLTEYLRSVQLVHTFADLMHAERLQHLLCQFHPKLPGSGIVFNPHRDIQHRINYATRAGGQWQDTNGEGSYVVGIIAVDSMAPSNGGLYALAGSHHHKDGPHDSDSECDFDSLQEHPNCEPLMLAAGDMVFLHPYLLHWSGQNQAADKTRYTLITGYCIAGANPNHNPTDYAGKSARYFIRAHRTGYSLEPTPESNAWPLPGQVAHCPSPS